ncbi:ComC/BlpC family peptide pheromone/bacteriocin [Streptococcus sp. 121]|uniref:ComC/BlpC family peptide pheromone/bacteriocin n=1 Tax=Streptococcus sp. 121 TaxID=2797637 RepID=UPI0018F0DB74|nr:ComC/BlpC family peptide pheromone/bacteriocin [Streptococcus sp. 121]MBJ6745185.1 ComC/BlpC family peptide pheromone/bacteriocin [Streptococcus sp. 121]
MKDVNKFSVLNAEELVLVNAGARVGGGEVFTAALAACGVGAAIGGLAGCILGAQYGTAFWTAVRLS